MAIPDYQTVMLPLLRFLSDGQEHCLAEAVDSIAEQFGLNDEERHKLLPSGTSTVIRTRVGWARTYLKKAGLIESSRRGHFRLSPRGFEVLEADPKKVDVQFLEQFPEFRAFRALRYERSDENAPNRGDARGSARKCVSARAKQAGNRTPRAHQGGLARFFRAARGRTSRRMGYGGSLRDAGQAVGRSGDGGIDGIIKEDRLGLDVLYVQAKRWDAPVGRPEIQKFVGALQGHRARKGVFITTSSFTKEAEEYVRMIDSKIVLVDGQTLAALMIDHNVGVAPVRAYELKRIDSDYFSEE